MGDKFYVSLDAFEKAPVFNCRNTDVTMLSLWKSLPMSARKRKGEILFDEIIHHLSKVSSTSRLSRFVSPLVKEATKALERIDKEETDSSHKALVSAAQRSLCLKIIARNENVLIEKMKADKKK